jgi:hypothetical protein
MFGSDILEVVVGLVFIFWLLSLICSTLNEGIVTVLAMRAKDLEKAIRSLLGGPDGDALASAFYNHGLIRVLKKGGRNPSYIPPRTFGLVVRDLLAAGAAPAKTIHDVRALVAKVQAQGLRESLLVLMDEAGSEVEKFQGGLETWFNDMMDRVSGWYKRKVQIVILGLGLVLVGAFNVDTIAIARYLHADAAARAIIIAKAGAVIEAPPAGQGGAPSAKESAIETVRGLKEEFLSTPVPLGWKGKVTAFWAWVFKIAGLLFTATAISLGAPFWFEFLEKVLKIRMAQAGVKPKPSE